MRRLIKSKPSLNRAIVWGISILVVCFVFLVSSCQGDQQKNIEQETSDPLDSGTDPAFEATGFPTHLQIPYFYNFDADSNRVHMELNEYYQASNLNLDTLIKAFNVYYPDIKLGYDHQVGDTVFVRIHDAMYLTQQIGSEGAAAYLAEVVYGLTELPNVGIVYFDFEEGDHAVPGLYDRAKVLNRNSVL